jgi:hypothetical protein
VDDIQAAPPSVIAPETGQTVGVTPANRPADAAGAPDKIQAAPPPLIAPETGQTVGVAPANRPADAAGVPGKIQAAPPFVIVPEGGQTVGVTPANRPADSVGVPGKIQAAPPSLITPEGGQTVGMALVNRPVDAAQKTVLPLIEGDGTPILTWSVKELLFLLVVALGLIEYLLSRTKRGLVYRAMRAREPPPEYVHWVEFPVQPQKQIQADSGAETVLKSVNRALDTIAQAEAEMASSPRLGKSV